MQTEKALALVALLGRRDEPADGVEDYCTFLGRALAKRGVEWEQMRLPWARCGRFRALRQIWQKSAAWRGKWVLLQYTALAWSRRGFPFLSLPVLWILRRRGARCAVVFHEPCQQLAGTRWRDRIRGACQDWTIRTLYRMSAKAIFADPLDSIEWLPIENSKAMFLPIGANIPEPALNPRVARVNDDSTRTVVVYCLSDPPNVHREVADIVSAVEFLPRHDFKTKLIFVGRGTAEAKELIASASRGTAAEIVNLGLRSPEDIAETLAGSDAMLCVRGTLYPRRGSAIAGIACELPIVGYGDGQRIFPIDEAGVVLAPYRDCQALGEALARVLCDAELRSQLRARSREAWRRYFSWDGIAQQLIQTLGLQ